MENTNKEYDVVQAILEETEREMQEEQEAAEREVGNYLQNRAQDNGRPEWDYYHRTGYPVGSICERQKR